MRCHSDRSCRRHGAVPCQGLTGQRTGELGALGGRLVEEKEVISLELKTVRPSDQGIHQFRRQINLPCGLGFGGLALKDHHSRCGNKVPNANARHLTDPTSGPIEDFGNEAVFLWQVGLDDVPLVLREDFCFARSIDLVEDGHGIC